MRPDQQQDKHVITLSALFWHIQAQACPHHTLNAEGCYPLYTAQPFNVMRLNGYMTLIIWFLPTGKQVN